MNTKLVNLMLVATIGLGVSTTVVSQEYESRPQGVPGTNNQSVDELLGMKKISELDTNIHYVQDNDQQRKIEDVKEEIYEMVDEDNRPTDAKKRFSHIIRQTRFVEPTFSPKALFWDAPNICYHPLYFEDIGVERYGQDAGLLQPALSGGHFFGRLATLPLHALVKPPISCDYPLGHFRPGNCNPYLHYSLPW